MLSAQIRAVIVDDEPLARQGIRLRLEDEPDFDVVAEYASARQACDGIRDLAPDVVFLDIQMPEMSGVDVARTIGASQSAVVFLTAYETHAVDAFEVSALDYVLKPASDERLDQALARIRAHVAAAREADIGRRVRQLVHDGALETAPAASSAAAALEVLHVRERGRIVLVRPSNVEWIESAGNYVRLHLRGRTHLAQYTISELERRLGATFVRIHRGTLVNRSRIVELQPHFHGDYVVVLDDRTVLRVGRKYRGALLRDD
jgi:two-component system LytT family response regulator